MELENNELFNELNNLVFDLDEETIQLSKELSHYVNKVGEIESGNIPESAYSEFDDEETLKELINIAKELSK